MTLRRCDSLPTRLREAPLPSPDSPQPKKLPDSNTVADFTEPPDREQVIATWKSLHTDVKKIKNGFPPKSESANHEADKKQSITPNFIPTFTCNNRRITYDNRQVGVAQEVDRCASYPLDTGQPKAAVKTVARRQTLLERLLSWRKRDCDCQDRYQARYRPAPKLRAEDLLCTCGVSSNRIKFPDEGKKYAERGRSKSVGYEAAREVTQFRRLVQCLTVGVGS